MYIGSTDTRGLMHCLWEIIDNGVDEALGGHCDRIDVLLHPDGSAEVRDNGRGIPVDKEPKTGLTGVEVVATKLHAGGKFGGGSYVATGGLHGVGLSVVNALSSRMDIDVDRSPSAQGMSFARGNPGVFDGDGPTAITDAELARAEELGTTLLHSGRRWVRIDPAALRRARARADERRRTGGRTRCARRRVRNARVRRNCRRRRAPERCSATPFAAQRLTLRSERQRDDGRPTRCSGVSEGRDPARPVVSRPR